MHWIFYTDRCTYMHITNIYTHPQSFETGKVTLFGRVRREEMVFLLQLLFHLVL